MTGYVPDLDDRTFEDLVEEARGLIPEIAPEWTDHNIHDPGITIIELLAFLVEQQIYRVGHVGPSLRRAFTRLMGIAPRSAEPARIHIWPLPGQPVPPLDLADRFTLQTTDLDDGQFMLDGATRIVSAHISDLRRVDPGGGVKPLGLGLVKRRSPLLIHAPQAGGPQFLEFDVRGTIAASDSAGPVSVGVLVGAAPVRAPGSPEWGPIVVEQKLGSAWQPLDVIDRTGGLTRSGTLRFSPVDTGTESTFRLRLDRGSRPGAVTLAALDLNVLAAVEGADEPASVVGDDTNEGNGRPDQSFRFETRTIVGGLDALSLTGPGETAGTSVAWTVVEDFAASGPRDAHVVIDSEAGTLTVGNGLNGLRLPRGSQLLHGPLTRTNGVAGNISKGLRWRLQGQVFGENIEPGQGGRDADTLNDLIARARMAASARTAHLTADGIKAFLDGTGLGLARVEILSGRRPGAKAKGSRTVWIVPERDLHAPPPAAPRLDVISAVQEVLEPARLLGERVYVSTPIYLSIDVDLAVLIERDADPATVRAAISDVVSARLWDLPRHPDVAPWPPGQTLASGDIRALLARVPDVMRMESCMLRPADGREADQDGKLRLSERECPLLRNLRLTLHRDEGGPS